ncbi:MAG: hypothetical protein NUV51_03850 [Sulfuricaulis sp.]|nr:hypothetical protein [Sulfuricaulis sp.]
MSAWGERWGERWGGRWGAVGAVARGGGWAWPAKREKRRKREREDAEERRKLIEAIVAMAMGLDPEPLPITAKTEVLQAIKPYTEQQKRSVKKALAPLKVDLPAILRDDGVMERVLAIYRDLEEEDELLLLT